MENKLTLKLFKTVVGNYSGVSKKAFEYGIFMPDCPVSIVDEAISLYGKSGALYNSLFHKNFRTVADETSYKRLVFQQAFHYMTTYGTDFTSDYIYIPEEAFDIPELKIDKIKFVNITTCTTEELIEKIKTLCSLPLKTETVQDVVDIVKSIGDSKTLIPELFKCIKNKEVLCAFCRILGITPEDPNEFLRYVIYLATGSTLKIKNKNVINKIKSLMQSDSRYGCYNPKLREEINATFLNYANAGTYRKLASIFWRDKDLFLAFKNKSTAKLFNKLNKLARHVERQHKKYKIVDHLTNPPEEGIGMYSLGVELQELPLRKELALIKTIDYRLNNPKYIEYRIRNGKSWYTECPSLTWRNKSFLRQVRSYIKSDIVEKLSKALKNKTVILPKNITYALPTSEKDFSGDIPNKSIITFNTDEALVLAVCWETECDIDLSILDNKGNKIGWNGYLRDLGSPERRCKTIFSGDMTCLDPNTGKASEAMYIEGAGYSGTVLVNLFSRWRGASEITGKIPFRFVIAKSPKLTRMNKNAGYSIAPENIIAEVNMQFDENGPNEFKLGTFEADEDGKTIKFVFDSGNNGMNNVSFSNTELETMRLDVMKTRNSSKSLMFDSELIEECGGIPFKVGPKDPIEWRDPNDCIDLTLENLSRETFIEILKEAENKNSR